MFFENKQQLRLISKWLIAIFASCILIYLSIRHIDTLADAVSWLIDLFLPLICGVFFALIFNVPMRPIEKYLSLKNKKLHRPIAIALSLLLIFGLFIGVAFLVIPEFINAVKIVIENLSITFHQLIEPDGTIYFSKLPFGNLLPNLSVNWYELHTQIYQQTRSVREQSAVLAVDTFLTLTNGCVTFFIGLVFSVYILFHKEKLKRQVTFFIRVWLPERFAQNLLHISSVCIATFQYFIAAQATEALILGILCLLGMLLLRLPYAPMISALVGVTSLLPVVGSYLGAVAGAFLIYTQTPLKALIFLIFLFILQQLEGDIIYPKLIETKINLPAIWVLAAITIGGRLGGPIGMFLGVPVFSSIYSLLKEATKKRAKQKSESMTKIPLS